MAFTESTAVRLDIAEQIVLRSTAATVDSLTLNMPGLEILKTYCRSRCSACVQIQKGTRAMERTKKLRLQDRLNSWAMDK